MPTNNLKVINNSIKSYINEANGISSRCKSRLIKLVEKHFFVDLPNEDYLNIDITILKNGNVIMRDVEYKTKEELIEEKDLYKRFNSFKEEVEQLLDKNSTNFETMKKNSERNNLIMVIFLTFVIVVIGLNAIRQILLGNLFGVLWLVIMIGYYVIPATGNNVRNRYIRAIKYLKSKFRK